MMKLQLSLFVVDRGIRFGVFSSTLHKLLLLSELYAYYLEKLVVLNY